MAKTCIECGKTKGWFQYNYAGYNTKEHLKGLDELILPGNSKTEFLCVNCANKREVACSMHGPIDGKFAHGSPPVCPTCSEELRVSGTDSLAELIQVMKTHKNLHLRIAAIRRLGDCSKLNRDPALLQQERTMVVGELIIQLLNDTNELVRGAAAESLGVLGKFSNEAREAMAAVVEDCCVGQPLRNTALGSLRKATGVDYLLREAEQKLTDRSVDAVRLWLLSRWHAGQLLKTANPGYDLRLKIAKNLGMDLDGYIGAFDEISDQEAASKLAQRVAPHLSAHLAGQRQDWETIASLTVSLTSCEAKEPMSTEPVRADWYFAESRAKHCRQVVVTLPPQLEVPPRVENLIGGGGFMAANWAVTVLFMPGDAPESKGPFVFAKASGVIEMLRHRPVTVAFAFYRMKRGGVIQIFVQVDSADIRAQAGYPFLAEHARWLEEDEDCRVIGALIERDKLEVCLVAPGEKGPCTGYLGLAADLPQECREVLKREWNELLAYHKNVTERDFQGALDQYNRENPLEDSPILGRTKL
ncbi:MAG: HEAT repeat domain-containing protein [Deltaproteobacteria bacterium]|nr:HEAT repeat domain-containing protein [Deltaproteobacteria bacterium]